MGGRRPAAMAPGSATRAVFTLLPALLLAACGGGGEPGPAAIGAGSVYPPAFPTDALIGSWGIASFRKDEDKARTEAMAKQQCSQPYVITKGPTDGVLMHAADDPVAKELKLKGAAGGQTYLGFEAPPGHWQDRIILSYDPPERPNVIVMKFITPEIDNRYGTFIYVRCNT